MIRRNQVLGVPRVLEVHEVHKDRLNGPKGGKCWRAGRQPRVQLEHLDKQLFADPGERVQPIDVARQQADADARDARETAVDFLEVRGFL